MRPGDGTRRMTDSDSIDLPHPLSPTMPSVLPAPHRQADAVHRRHFAVPGAKDRAQPFDGEQRTHRFPPGIGMILVPHAVTLA